MRWTMRCTSHAHSTVTPSSPDQLDAWCFGWLLIKLSKKARIFRTTSPRNGFHVCMC